LTDRLRARLARREWTVTVEVVTPSPHDAAARDRILAEAGLRLERDQGENALDLER